MKPNTYAFIISIDVFLMGIIMFMTGMKNIDAGYNVAYLNSLGGNFTDSSFALANFTAPQLYSLGIMMTMLGFVVSIVGVSLLIALYKKADNK